MGTLKAARKRGIIDIKGQIWLKGAHDKVPITLLSSGSQPAAAAALPPARPHAAPPAMRASPPAPAPPAPVRSATNTIDNFTYQAGYMPTGNDVHSATMSVADAQKWCAKDAKARGFTFEGNLPLSCQISVDYPPPVPKAQRVSPLHTQL